MLFASRRPAAPLDAFVESVWVCRNDPRPRALERVLPPGGAQLIVNLAEDETRIYRVVPAAVSVCDDRPAASSAGMTTRYQIIDTDEQEYVAGVAFLPGGTRAVLRGAGPRAERRGRAARGVLGPHARRCACGSSCSARRIPDAALDALEAALAGRVA